MGLKTFGIFFLLAILSTGFVLGDNPLLLVHTTKGRVRGGVDYSTDGEPFYVFLGIPYAAPPVGQLRFKPPQPARIWSSIKDGTEMPPKCIQDNSWEGEGIVGQEDCLYLNVFTKSDFPPNDGEQQPVMVWIHGGSFVFGSGTPDDYAPNVLMNQDIVLVTLNYRLGPFGFLSTADEVIQGNMALKDQTMALRWVNENIELFGGDPKRITIFGESAGGASTHYHLLSPLSRGLFHRAISQSGSAYCPWAYMEPEEISQRSKKFARLLKCPTEDSEGMLRCMQGLDAEQIASFIASVSEWMVFPAAPFAPTREVAGEGRFLEERPRDLIAQGKVADVPWMTGITENEGEYIAAGIWKQDMLEDLNKNYLKVFPIIFNYEYYAKDPDQLSREIRQHYFGDKDISEDTMENLIAMTSDLALKYPGLEVALEHHPKVKSPIYFYEMTFMGGYSFSQNAGPIGGGPDYRPTGTSHGDDLFYIFSPPIAFSQDSAEDRMSDKMTAWWTNFAATGNPTPRGGDESDVVWDNMKHNEVNYFDINTSPSMQVDIFAKEDADFLEKIKTHMKWYDANSGGRLAGSYVGFLLLVPFFVVLLSNM